MGEQASLAGWRLRAASRAGAVLACAGLAALLVAVSRGVIMLERPIAAVEMVIEQAPPAPPEQQTQRATPSAPTASFNSAAPATPSIDAAMGAALLRCVVRPGQPRPPGCPSEPAPQDWESPRLPVGGRYAPPDAPNMERIFTQAERETLVMPSCVRDKNSTVCIRIGQRPPPPSRSPEQLCQQDGLGGPCAPPPDAVSAP